MQRYALDPAMLPEETRALYWKSASGRAHWRAIQETLGLPDYVKNPGDYYRAIHREMFLYPRRQELAPSDPLRMAERLWFRPGGPTTDNPITDWQEHQQRGDLAETETVVVPIPTPASLSLLCDTGEVEVVELDAWEVYEEEIDPEQTEKRRVVFATEIGGPVEEHMDH